MKCLWKELDSYSSARWTFGWYLKTLSHQEQSQANAFEQPITCLKIFRSGWPSQYFGQFGPPIQRQCHRSSGQTSRFFSAIVLTQACCILELQFLCHHRRFLNSFQRDSTIPTLHLLPAPLAPWGHIHHTCSAVSKREHHRTTLFHDRILTF